jgi:hypothetical protein
VVSGKLKDFDGSCNIYTVFGCQSQGYMPREVMEGGQKLGAVRSNFYRKELRTPPYIQFKTPKRIHHHFHPLPATLFISVSTEHVKTIKNKNYRPCERISNFFLEL